jgi:hypothetical protein
MMNGPSLFPDPLIPSRRTGQGELIPSRGYFLDGFTKALV